mgnify:CR=1 FL=1
MRYIIYILFVGLLFAQDIQEPKTYSFTEDQVLGFTNAIKELELKDSLNVSLVSDYEAMVKRLESTAAIDSMLIGINLPLLLTGNAYIPASLIFTIKK